MYCKSLKLLMLAVIAELCLTVAASATQLSAAELDFPKVAAILSEHCLDCHNAQTHQGTIDLERFDSIAKVDEARPLWKMLFDVVEAGQMPLPGSGYDLSPSARGHLLDFAREILSRPDPILQAVDPGKPMLRRLTRLEYNNTVRDLLGVNYDIFIFPERLPVADKRYFTESGQDLGNVIETSMREYGQKYDVLLPHLGLAGDNRAEHGFANRGDALNFSPLLFENYLQLASAIASSERLLRDSPVLQDLLAQQPPPPEPHRAASTAQGLSGTYPLRDRIGGQAAENDTGYGKFAEELAEAATSGLGGSFDVPANMSNRVIAGKGGLIKVKLLDRTLTINPNVDLWLAGFATADETSGELLLTNRNKGEKQFELTFAGEDDFDPEIQQLGVCVLARRNQAGLVKLTAVLSGGARIERQAEISETTGNIFYSWAASPGTHIKKLLVDGGQFSGDHVLLDDLAFILPAKLSAQRPRAQSGAATDQAGGKSMAASASTATTPAKAEPAVPAVTAPREFPPLEQRMTTFLSRAYRRSVTAQELSGALEFVVSQTAEAGSESAALRRLVQSVLASPDFLYLAEPARSESKSTESKSGEPARVRRLEAFELANRLSYFLWSTMPDDALLAAAQSGKLQDATHVRAEVRRMLADRWRVRELSESFAAQWLRLDQIYSSKPDRELYQRFYAGPQGKTTLHGPMMTEALLLFETVLVEDRSVLELYDPNFSWLNSDLAALYELQQSYEQAQRRAQQLGQLPTELPEKSAGKVWLRTELPDRQRGGIMTMAGPLLVTSLPFRTSPVKRGAWLLETVFNRPPAEPKVAFVLEEVAAADGQVNAASEQTIRQKFERHRQDPNCNSCHSRIDPPGFSLECFDAIGGLRTHDGSQPVDASGTWNGAEFNGPAEFKEAILLNEREVVRGLVEHLLSYALGRKLAHYDMSAVEQVVAAAAEHNYRLSAIIEGIALSYPFQNVRM